MKQLIQLCVILTILCTSTSATAQPDFSDDPYFSRKITYELGGSIGVMNCLTDLGGNKGVGKKFVKDLNAGSTQPAGSVYFSAVYKNAVVLRSEASWGIVKASDDVLKSIKESTYGRYERNLSFRSTIFEISLVTEIHPRFFKTHDKTDKLPRLSPYLLGGIGYFVFDPKAKINGVWEELRPLKTEGQGFAEYPERKAYKLNQINFPVGGGVKYKLSSMFSFSAEMMYRILNTDYLDDVSSVYIDKSLFQKYLPSDKVALALALYNRQAEINPSHNTNVNDTRGNPKNNDAYFSVNFKLAYVF